MNQNLPAVCVCPSGIMFAAGAHPLVTLLANQALGIAMFSYDGRLPEPTASAVSA